jgi:hypothetical protein
MSPRFEQTQMSLNIFWKRIAFRKLANKPKHKEGVWFGRRPIADHWQITKYTYDSASGWVAWTGQPPISACQIAGPVEFKEWVSVPVNIVFNCKKCQNLYLNRKSL